ncbi:MAG TPA: efflux RND transporter periplasmic adaptor subunit, partial [Candidatus Eisenbacteria bacterium]
GSRAWAGGQGAGAGAGGGAGANGSSGGFVGAGSRANRAQVVFVKTARGLEPRIVRLGLTNFDYAEVLDGLNEGDQVALLSVAEIQAKRQQDQSRMRQRMGGGVPGVPTGGGGGARGGGR